MIKKTSAILVIVVMLAGVVATGHCDNAIHKLGRGLSNALGAPYELFLQPSKVNSCEGMTRAIIWGIPKGIAMTLIRAVAGVYETGTFLVPLPRAYKPVIDCEPEILIKDLDWQLPTGECKNSK